MRARVTPREITGNMLRVLNVLIVVSLLLGAVTLMGPQSAVAAAAKPQGVKEAEPEVGERRVALSASGPQEVVPGEEIELAVEVWNIGSQPLEQAWLQLREEPGMGLAGRARIHHCTFVMILCCGVGWKYSFVQEKLTSCTLRRLYDERRETR